MGCSPHASFFPSAVWCVIVWMVGSTAGLAWAGPDWSQLPMSNGHAAAVFDLDSRKLTAFYEHPYRFPAPGVESADLCYDAYSGIAMDGKGVWLNTVPLEPGAGYVPATGMVRTKQLVGEFVVETTLFAPMSAPGAFMVSTTIVTHTGKTPRVVSVFSLHNYHVGKGSPIPTNHQERIVWNGVGYVETAAESNRVAVYLPVGGATVHGSTPHNPYGLIQGGQLVEVDDSGVVDDAVGGFQKDFGTLSPGQSVSFAVVTALSGEGIAGKVLLDQIQNWVAGRTAEQLVAAEQADWATWQGVAAVPKSGSEVLYRQSLATLRMAQVREPNTASARPHGQILASLPPGQWAISWPRDAAYAISALSAAGYFEEAKAALDFMFGAQTGGYSSYLNGVPYLISVCRYYGNGMEESDGNPDKEGPNIELDDFGLFLWALGQYVQHSGDVGYFAGHFAAVRDLVAGALVKLVEDDLGILVKDSSIWERHWNGNEKHFTYSTLVAIRGLCDAAHWADGIGETTVASEWKKTARNLQQGMLTHLVDGDGALVGNLEEKAGGLYADAAVVEAINLGVLPMLHPAGPQTLALLETKLKLPSGGYKRNDDGDWYDEQEWIFIDLRVKKAMEKLGMPKTDTAARVIGKTLANHGLFAELYTADGAYAGAVPMVGYGAGVYVLDLLENEAADVLAACLTESLEIPPDPDAGEVVSGDASGDGDTGVSPRDGSSVDGETPTDVGIVADAPPIATDFGQADETTMDSGSMIGDIEDGTGSSPWPDVTEPKTTENDSDGCQIAHDETGQASRWGVWIAIWALCFGAHRGLGRKRWRFPDTSDK